MQLAQQKEVHLNCWNSLTALLYHTVVYMLVREGDQGEKLLLSSSECNQFEEISGFVNHC